VDLLQTLIAKADQDCNACATRRQTERRRPCDAEASGPQKSKPFPHALESMRGARQSIDRGRQLGDGLLQKTDRNLTRRSHRTVHAGEAGL